MKTSNGPTCGKKEKMKGKDQMKKKGLFKNVRASVLVLTTLWVLLSGQVALTEEKTIYYDYIDEKGELRGGMIVVEVEKIEVPKTLFLDSGSNVETIIDNGPTWNRVDLVFVGDGYQESELDQYASDVACLMAGFFAEWPLDEYASFFNVHRVDVTSTDSGVDNEDYLGQERDTALNMGFWRFGIERYLGWEPYGDIQLALNAADLAPDRDQVLALANTAKYGGAGFSSEGVATASGHEELGWTSELGLHEIGHSLAELGDEYWYENRHYWGPEPDIANLSIYEADDMAAEQRKWYRWLDEPTVPPAHGPIHTYQGGGGVYATGIYRPTDWSKMRELDYPFHQVNVEQFILEIYKIVDAVDYATPEGTYALGTQFFVEPLQPATHSLDVQWYLNEDEIPGATETTFDASTLGLPPGEYTLSVKVVDNTEMVRDEDRRVLDMTFTREWTLLFNDSSHLNDTSKFYVKNASGENVAWFGNLGNIVLRGTFTSGEVIDTAPLGSFIIKDSTDDTVAYIDNEGNLCIEGSKLSGSCNPEGYAFIIKNSSDANVSYIDFANGDLCLIGELIDYSNP